MSESDEIPPTDSLTCGPRPAPIPTASSLAVVAVIAGVGDPDGTRVVSSIVALLTVLGIGLVMLAVWLFKLTKPDRELLAPLEVMGERKWRRADPVWQRRRLDEVRPPTAQPLQPSAAPPVLDEAYFKGPSASGFDDLQETAPEPSERADGGVADASPPSGAEPGDAAHAADVADDADGTDDADLDESELAARRRRERGLDGEEQAPRPTRPTSPTPIGTVRPSLDGLPDRDIDPDLLAAAMAELDAELRRAGERNQQSPE